MTTTINTAQPRLIEAPVSDAHRLYETLGYVEAYDAVLNGDYAFVAYKETERSSGNSLVKIASRERRARHLILQ